jgi:hypothetical protein
MIKTAAQRHAPHSAHGLRRSARRPALRGRLGHSLAAQPSRGGGPRRVETGLAGVKVLPASTGGVPRWRRARRMEAGLTEVVGRLWDGGKWPVRWCSGGRAAPVGWRRPRRVLRLAAEAGKVAAGAPF